MGTCAGKDEKFPEYSSDAPIAEPTRRRLTVSGSGVKGETSCSSTTKGETNVLELFKNGKQKIAICGMACDAQQKGFADKMVTTQPENEDISNFRVGWSCKKGLKPDSPNQDDFCILRVDNTSIYGVFDGHGPCGHDVSNFVQEALPRLFVEHPKFNDEPLEALSAAFTRTHTLCIEAQLEGQLDCTLSGTTATLAMHRDGVLYIAHVGDSRAIIGKMKNGVVEFEDLTEDHKPASDEERKRIETAGGEVRRLEGDIPYRVFLRGKMYPGLAMTRAIGDTVGTVAGVTSTPTVRALEVQEDWRFMLLCSDGIWEFISSKEAVDIVNGNPMSDPQAAAEELALEAWNRWIQEEGNVVDDITVVLTWFRHEQS